MAKNNSTIQQIIQKISTLIEAKGLVMLADVDSITVEQGTDVWNVKVIYNSDGVAFGCDGHDDPAIDEVMLKWLEDQFPRQTEESQIQ